MNRIFIGITAAIASIATQTASGVNITTPGIHSFCSTSAFSLPAETGIAITVNADDVVIDLCDITVVNNASDANTSTFVYATGRRNVTIRNGGISGFLFGIRFEGNGQGYRVENMHVQSPYIGIWIDGRSSVVKDNVLTGIGGSHAGPAYTMPIAIWARGAGTRVTGNIITDVIRPTWYAGGDAYAIYADAMPGGVIAGNILTNTVRDSTSVSAITLKDMDPARPTWVSVMDNTITNFPRSIFFSLANGKYGGNVIQNSACPSGGGTDIGGNSCP